MEESSYGEWFEEVGYEIIVSRTCSCRASHVIIVKRKFKPKKNTHETHLFFMNFAFSVAYGTLLNGHTFMHTLHPNSFTK